MLLSIATYTAEYVCHFVLVGWIVVRVSAKLALHLKFLAVKSWILTVSENWGGLGSLQTVIPSPVSDT